MAKTALDLSPKELRNYRPAEAIQRHQIEHQAEIDIRREKAWMIARQAAVLLKKEYGASRVVVFGSLAHEAWFTPWSDIDLATWGIPPSKYFYAVAAMIDLDQEIKIDLVDAESCRPNLQNSIRQEGIEL